MILRASLLLIILSACLHAKAADERFSVSDWNKRLATSLKRDGLQKAARLLDMKSLEAKVLPSCTNCSEKMKLTRARKLFAEGKYTQAIALYNQIPKGTDYWFQAVEERGWGHFRQENMEKALAQTKTLISPQFSEVVSSEAFFLQSLSQLRMCDYKSVFETHALFKEKQKARIMAIQELAVSGMNEAFTKVIAKADKFPLRMTDAGSALSSLPLLFYKDTQIQSELLKYKISQKAIETLRAANYSKLQAQMERLNSASMAKLIARMKDLAQQETEANFKIVQKLNLVEVEAIQRVHTDLAMDKSLYNEKKFEKVNDDQLVFMDDGRPWIDELDKYEVAAKSCAKDIRRKM
ncbi:hypothetical protein D3C87_300110 [compost metagenome]